MKKGKRPPALSREDLALWQRVSRTVSAYPGKDIPFSEEIEETIIPTPPRPGVRQPASARSARQPALPYLAAGDLHLLDRNTAERLRKGQMPKAGRLDLHGHTQEEAAMALLAFIRAAVERRKRCVLVITGKGKPRGEGILQRQVPLWLNQPGLREHIVAFCHAAVRDGGEGALYVLLKRRREDDG